MVLYQDFPLQMFTRGDFLISSDPDKIDIGMVHHYLAYESYWASDVTRQTVVRFLRYSLCYGIYDQAAANDTQFGFARVISDFTTFVYLADVFVLASYRGQGLGKWLISCILAHDELKGVRKWTLNTRDAHDLYREFGFHVSPNPQTHMTYRPQR
jgi:GNAT superfamily N-acetyltransferase